MIKIAINKEKNTRIVITIDKETKEKLQQLANADNRTMTNYVVNLIKKDIDKNYKK